MDRGRLSGEVEAVYRTRYNQFVRVARAITGDEATAHDAVQEGFARALRSGRSYRGRGTVEAWLWPIVLNAARASARRTPPLPLPSGEAAPSQNGSGSGFDAQVRGWIAALPERQRLAIFLRYYADLDYRGIADALGVEVGTVSATLSSAHAALREAATEATR